MQDQSGVLMMRLHAQWCARTGVHLCRQHHVDEVKMHECATTVPNAQKQSGMHHVAVDSHGCSMYVWQPAVQRGSRLNQRGQRLPAQWLAVLLEHVVYIPPHQCHVNSS